MQTSYIQSAVKRSQRSLLFYFLSCSLVLLVAAFFSLISFKKELAISSLVQSEGSLINGDYRSALFELNLGLSRHFNSIKFNSSDGKTQFAIPPEAEKRYIYFPYHFKLDVQPKSFPDKIGTLEFEIDLHIFILIAATLITAAAIALALISRKINQRIVKDYEQSLAMENKIALGELSAQVSHDIRSPLAALNMGIKSMHMLPIEQRELIENAAIRINDIANQLLAAGRHIDNTYIGSGTESAPDVRALVPLIESVLSEKRIQILHRKNLQISSKLDNGYGIFCKISFVEFSRALSNLIDNAIDSISDSGRIEIELQREDQFITISIEDTGCGIPQHILNKIGDRGFSHGKSGKGSGLGIFHAKNFLNEIGGKFNLAPSPNSTGTIAMLTIPTCNPPFYHVERINITKDKVVVCVDNDQAIHSLWRKRLGSVPHFLKNESFCEFFSSAQFSLWMSKNSHSISNHLFLIDFDFPNEQENGLSLIAKYNLCDRAILVTARHDQDDILLKARELDIPVLPKSLASIVPIHGIANAKHYAAIVIDDDINIHDMWQIYAKAKGKEVRCFSAVSQFLVAADEINQSSPIFVDLNINYVSTQKGDRLSERIAKRGFKKIFLSTGEAGRYRGKIPKHIVQIIGKDPIFFD